MLGSCVTADDSNLMGRPDPQPGVTGTLSQELQRNSFKKPWAGSLFPMINIPQSLGCLSVRIVFLTKAKQSTNNINNGQRDPQRLKCNPPSVVPGLHSWIQSTKYQRYSKCAGSVVCSWRCATEQAQCSQPQLLHRCACVSVQSSSGLP